MEPSVEMIKQFAKTKRPGMTKYLDLFANYLTFYFWKLGLTPSQITYSWVILQAFSTILLAFGNYYLSILGIFLFQFMFIIDLCDGKLARLNSHLSDKVTKKPLLPKYLDRLGHYLNNSLLFIFLGVGVWQQTGNLIYVIIGLASAYFISLNKALTMNACWYKGDDEIKKICSLYHGSHPRSNANSFRIFIFDIIRTEQMFNILFFAIILNFSKEVLILYTFLFFVELLRKIMKSYILLYKEDK